MAALTLMKTASTVSNRAARAAAWFLAILCLWMATVGLAHHTDLLRDGGSSSARTMLGHAAALDAPDDLCAACQWAQTVQTGGSSLCVLSVPPVNPPSPSFTAPSALLSGPSRPSSPRAPPVSLLPKHPVSFA